MTEKRKKLLKRVGKGALYIAATGGAYILAKGTLHLILNLLEPAKEVARGPAKEMPRAPAKEMPRALEKPASSRSRKKRALTPPKSKPSPIGART
jgi:hypothetical protein